MSASGLFLMIILAFVIAGLAALLFLEDLYHAYKYWKQRLWPDEK